MQLADLTYGVVLYLQQEIIVVILPNVEVHLHVVIIVLEHWNNLINTAIVRVQILGVMRMDVLLQLVITIKLVNS
jgi:hypothetical protein